MRKKNPAAVALGTLGGRKTSEAKAAAVRENGKKGGRPEAKADVIGFEGLYAVTKSGKVWSYAKITPRMSRWGTPSTKSFPAMWLKPAIDRDGYCCVHLKKDKKLYPKKVHRLVASAYLSNPDNLPSVNHKNGIKTDNRVKNLEWCNRRENTLHAIEKGLINFDEGGRFKRK